MDKSNLTWGNSCLFISANIGDINLFNYWMNKGFSIDTQDEDGDTALHYAVRGGHIDLVIYLLEKRATIKWNKNQESPLQLAYKIKKFKAAYEITQSIIKEKSKIDRFECQELNLLVNDFIKFLNKNYLQRNIFLRFPAKHTERAKALIVAVQKCSSIKQFKDLLNNQLNLFEKTPAQPLSKSIIGERWSKFIKNKPLDINKSQFYKIVSTFVLERFSTQVNSKNCTYNTIQQRHFFKS